MEALGILGNLTLMDLDYLKIIEEFHLLPFISSVLQVSPSSLSLLCASIHCPSSQAPKVEDDVTLEVVILVGTLALDESTATVLASQGIIPLMIELLKGELVPFIRTELLQH